MLTRLSRALPSRKFLKAVRAQQMEPSLPVFAYVSVLIVCGAGHLSSAIRNTPRRVHAMMPNPLWLWPMLACGPISVLGQNYSHGTAIAVIRTDDNIFIAADSRAVGGAGEKHPDICKIRIVGDYFFSVHGVGDQDVLDAIRTVLLGPENIVAKILLIRDRIRRAVTDRMRGQSQETALATGVLVFGLENSIIRLAFVRFPAPTPTIPSPEPSSIRDCPGSDCPDGIALWSVSPYGDALATSARTLDDARNFVLGQIDKGNALEKRDGGVAVVGPPIQSLTLDRSGKHEWHDHPDVCKDQP